MFQRSTFQRSAQSPGPHGAQIGWAATSTMIGGLVVWGGLGWLLDLWWSTQFATPIGAVIGIAAGVYAVVMRYGRPEEQPTEESTDPGPGSQHVTIER